VLQNYRGAERLEEEPNPLTSSLGGWECEEFLLMVASTLRLDRRERCGGSCKVAEVPVQPEAINNEYERLRASAAVEESERLHAQASLEHGVAVQAQALAQASAREPSTMRTGPDSNGWRTSSTARGSQVVHAGGSA